MAPGELSRYFAGPANLGRRDARLVSTYRETAFRGSSMNFGTGQIDLWAQTRARLR